MKEKFRMWRPRPSVPNVSEKKKTRRIFVTVGINAYTNRCGSNLNFVKITSTTGHSLLNGVKTFTAAATIFAGTRWPRGLRRLSAAARLLRLCVRIPPGARMFVCYECCQVEVSAMS